MDCFRRDIEGNKHHRHLADVSKKETKPGGQPSLGCSWQQPLRLCKSNRRSKWKTSAPTYLWLKCSGRRRSYETGKGGEKKNKQWMLNKWWSGETHSSGKLNRTVTEQHLQQENSTLPLMPYYSDVFSNASIYYALFAATGYNLSPQTNTKGHEPAEDFW